MKKILSLFSVIFLLCFTSAKAEMSFGVGLLAGQVSASGTETEGTAADTSARSKDFDEFFLGADIFAEYELANGYTVGLSYVPVDVELGEGKRSDTTAGADIASEADTGDRSAKAELSNLFTLYTNIPVSGNYYGLAGLHYTTVETSETLPNSTYGNEDIFGYQIGFGLKDGNSKVELFYSDFEDISISSTGGNTNKVEADADALTLRVSIGF